MKKLMKMIVINILIMTMLIGCPDSGSRKFYDVEYGAFIVEVTNSLLGIPNNRDADFSIIEEDDYGRLIYVFYGFGITAEKDKNIGQRLWAILIQQKADDEYVYFYPDFNFIVKELPEYKGSVSESVFLEMTYYQLPKEEIETLKENNDWNKAIDIDKMVKRPILDFDSTKKAARVSKDTLRKVFDDEFQDNYPNFNTFFNYLTFDNYDRDIFFCRTIDDDREFANSYVIMFFPDDSYLIYEMNDLWNYQEELKKFKDSNFWNQPLLE